MAEARRFFAPRAWVAGAWARDVLLASDGGGSWSEVRTGCEAPTDAEVLPGAVLPGLVNGHSHAFQRAIAGLAERGTAGHDDFWSWRERMYAVALRITPPQLEAIAAFLYAELLQAGYTHVCEFHYLHNDADGRPYADPLEMSLALVRAAQRAGIGLTLLPALYMRSGFAASGLSEHQRRFASTPESVLGIAQALRRQASPLLAAGIALHSLRAVDDGALRETAAAARQAGMPVHMHVAEQQAEVDDCLARHWQRPIEWLLANAPVDSHWNLVHATRSTEAELEGVRDAGAGIVLCPTTEANLGDGVFDLGGWLALQGRCCIGSDSHVTRDWCEELRLLEYTQRVVLRRRNVAGHAAGQESSAGVLFGAALAGGSGAAGLRLGGFAVGERADFCLPDPQALALAGVPPEHLLDALVFSSPRTPMARVCVAGRDVPLAPPREGFLAAMRSLW
ncbi:formimidoylglutamate deiminase [Ramlibacter sp. AN1133]|uniref:formimidoylglutamate deiminase n=1 Tax=Ramlibacter sp. AN1133 TaxID=3133429 RepID=UPI0030BD7FD7